ncbi:MAG: HAD family hydrolase, partial [Rhodococcus sp. (in: high G+C Gram-positive bacteria)]
PVYPFFDDSIFSCDVGLLKPDPAIFRLSLENLHVHPAEALFVGDGGSREMQGAKQTGLGTVCTEYLRRHPAKERRTIRKYADHTIRQFSELPEIVKASNSVGGGTDASAPGVAEGGAAPAWTPVSTSAVAPAAPGQGTGSTKCTDQINYVGDPRSNAEINSIGERMGSCPAPLPPGAIEPPEKCTDQINYGADPRSNAEINIIGEQTGVCPEPIRP